MPSPGSRKLAWLLNALVTTASASWLVMTVLDGADGRGRLPFPVHGDILLALATIVVVGVVARAAVTVVANQAELSAAIRQLSTQQDGEEYARGYLDGVARKPPAQTERRLVSLAPPPA